LFHSKPTDPTSIIYSTPNQSRWTLPQSSNNPTGKLSEKKTTTHGPTALSTGEVKKDTNLSIVPVAEEITVTTQTALPGTKSWPPSYTKKIKRKGSFYLKKKKSRKESQKQKMYKSTR
jgi:hypothetical protein